MQLPTQTSRKSPAGPFDSVQRDFDQLLSRLFHAEPAAGESVLTSYAVDIRESQDHLHVEAELPGFKKEDIELTLEDGTLTISAQRKIENAAETAGGKLLLNERRNGRFLRRFKLPPTVDGQTVDAKLADGVLTVTLKKRDESKPRKITVM